MVSPSTFGGLPVELLHRLGALAALAASVLLMVRIHGPDGEWGERLRSRFVLGVPWGTLVVVTGVVGFYLTAQHGWNHWFDPVTLPYHAWSYFYPLGMVTAAFAHAGSAHLVGNMTTTLAVFPLAEYAYGHYPRRRGSQSFATWHTNPLFRALVVVPVGTFVVGLLTALFSWGPIIGFSGVLFAGIGFTAVRYPLGTVVAVVAQGAVKLVYRVLLNPIVVAEASERFVRPGWAGIAVQGHALGLFIGVGLGVVTFYRDRLVALPTLGVRGEDPPSPLRVWAGVLLVGLSLGLHLVWWPRGPGRFALFRAAGLAFVALTAALVAAAVTGSDGPLAGEDGLTGRQVAVLVLLVPLVVMSVVAVVPNTLTVEGVGAPPGTETVERRDYTVFYAEGVRSGMYSVAAELLPGKTGTVNTSGVIVVSERRSVWFTAVSKAELAARGHAEVVLGGLTWRETVFVKREGWSALGGGSAYRVRIGPARGDTRVAFTSDAATAGAVLRGRNVSVVPATGGFRLRVSHNGTTLGTAPVPGRNGSTTVAGITFVRDGDVVEARVDGTRVDVFRRETY